MTKSPRAIYLESNPLPPAAISVAGDASTPAGARYAGTFADDYRQDISWGPEHERVLLSMVTSARRVGGFNVPDGDAARLFVVPLAEELSGCFSDDAGHFDVLFEDGRQRRRCSIVLEERLSWLRPRVLKIWKAEASPAARAEKLCAELAALGQVRAGHLPGQLAAKDLPPTANDLDVVLGDYAAPWLTEAFAEALATGDWFDEDGDSVPLALKVDVVSESPDLANDDSRLLGNLLRKEASVATPIAQRARQYQRLLDVRDVDGSAKYTVHGLAVRIGVGHDMVANALNYARISKTIRSAVDAGVIALKLAVTGRDCICFAFDKAGTRVLLSVERQDVVFGRLVDAFGPEAREPGGVPDNASTRAVLRKIRGEVLEGTQFNDGAASVERPTQVRARAAAERVGVAIDADMMKPLDRIAADEARAADAKDADAAKTKPDKAGKAPASRQDDAVALPLPATATPLRKALEARAGASAGRVGAVDLRGEGPWSFASADVALAAGLAVARALGGDSSMLLRFPSLCDAVAAATPAAVKSASKTAAASAAATAGHTTSIEDLAREVVATLVTMWEAEKEKGRDTKMSSLIFPAAMQACGDDVDDDVTAASKTLLARALSDYESLTTRRHDDIAVHVRETAFPPT